MEDVVLVTYHSENQKREGCSQLSQHRLIADVEASQEDLRQSYPSPSELSVPRFRILYFLTFHSLLCEVKYSVFPVYANCL